MFKNSTGNNVASKSKLFEMGAGGSQSTTNQGSKARAGELSTTAAMLAIGKHDSAANAAANNITAGFPVGN